VHLQFHSANTKEFKKLRSLVSQISWGRHSSSSVVLYAHDIRKICYCGQSLWSSSIPFLWLCWYLR